MFYGRGQIFWDKNESVVIRVELMWELKGVYQPSPCLTDAQGPQTTGTPLKDPQGDGHTVAFSSCFYVILSTCNRESHTLALISLSHYII